MVGVLLIAAFLSVKNSRSQIAACFILVSISEVFFSRFVPTFLCGCCASFLSISTYFATLGQLPRVILEKDARYINLPMAGISVVNGLIWTAYAVLKKDIPLFMTNALACGCMLVNLTFYLWANDMVATSSIQLLISLVQIAFPSEESDDTGVPEQQLDCDLDDECIAKADQLRSLKSATSA